MFESGIQKIHFQGVFGKLENLLGIKMLYGYNHEMINDLYLSMIASLSRFDLRLIKNLSNCENLLEDYSDVLLQFAKKNEWDKVKYREPEDLTEHEIWERWSKGILEYKDNKIVYNSANLLIHNENDELETRLWISGLEVLLPFIEGFRKRVLKCNKLIFPFKCQNRKTGQLKTNKLDFEIGDICYLIKNREVQLRWLSLNEKTVLIDFLNLSKDIRNDLAHLKFPKADDIKKFYTNYQEVYGLLDPVY